MATNAEHDAVGAAAQSAQPVRRRRFARNALLVLVAMSPALGHWIWRAATAPRPPEIQLTDLEPPVARLIRQARNSVSLTPRSGQAWGELGLILLAHDLHSDAHVCLARAEEFDPTNPCWPYLQTITPGASDAGLAVPKLKRAIELCGTEPAPRLRLGEVLLEHGRLDEADQQFQQVLVRDVENPRAHAGLGRIAHARGDLAASLDHLERSIAAAFKVRSTHSLLADVYHRLDDPEAAERHHRLAASAPELVVWPDPYLEQVARHEIGQTALIRQAVWNQKGGRSAEALIFARRAVQLYPDSAEAHRVLGLVLVERRDFAAAEPLLEKAVELEPENAEAHFYRGVALAQQGRHEAAVASLQTAAQLRPEAGFAQFELGQSLYVLGDRERAAAAWRVVVRNWPEFAHARKGLGLLLAELGEFQEAVTHLEKAVALAPNDVDARRALDGARQHVVEIRNP